MKTDLITLFYTFVLIASFVYADYDPSVPVAYADDPKIISRDVKCQGESDFSNFKSKYLRLCCADAVRIKIKYISHYCGNAFPGSCVNKPNQKNDPYRDSNKNDINISDKNYWEFPRTHRIKRIYIFRYQSQIVTVPRLLHLSIYQQIAFAMLSIN